MSLSSRGASQKHHKVNDHGITSASHTAVWWIDKAPQLVSAYQPSAEQGSSGDKPRISLCPIMTQYILDGCNHLTTCRKNLCLRIISGLKHQPKFPPRNESCFDGSPSASHIKIQLHILGGTNAYVHKAFYARKCGELPEAVSLESVVCEDFKLIAWC